MKQQEDVLIKKRHDIGLYRIEELAMMFGISRFTIDKAVKTGQLKALSPSGRGKFIFLEDYLNFIEKRGKT